jgi:hypothetical protein
MPGRSAIRGNLISASAARVSFTPLLRASLPNCVQPSQAAHSVAPDRSVTFGHSRVIASLIRVRVQKPHDVRLARIEFEAIGCDLELSFLRSAARFPHARILR